MKTKSWPSQIFLLALTLLSLSFSSCGSPQKFENPDYMESQDKSFFDVLKWRLTSERANWPDWIKTQYRKVISPKASDQLKATFVNHATVLVHMNGSYILTDPIWSERPSPVSFAGPKRVRNPGIKFHELPKIDAVVISHNHYDHFDIPTLKKLIDVHNPYILVGLNSSKVFKRNGINTEKIVELDWEEEFKFMNDKNEEITITFLPAQHWSMRGPFDRNQMLWGAYLLQSNNHKVYFAGDTGYSPHFSKLQEQYGPVDLALLPIGAYLPRWFMRIAHLNPDDAVQAHIDLNATNSMAIHFGTFQLSDEGMYEPHFDLKKALRERGISKENFVLPRFGETYFF